MEEAKSILTTSEFNDSQSNFPQTVIQTSNNFKDNNNTNKIAASGNLTHFGSREQHDSGMGGLNG